MPPMQQRGYKCIAINSEYLQTAPVPLHTHIYLRMQPTCVTCLLCKYSFHVLLSASPAGLAGQQWSAARPLYLLALNSDTPLQSVLKLLCVSVYGCLLVIAKCLLLFCIQVVVVALL